VQTDETKEVWQFHYQYWPDRGIPDNVNGASCPCVMGDQSGSTQLPHKAGHPTNGGNGLHA
jgi:hypothetical protein